MANPYPACWLTDLDSSMNVTASHADIPSYAQENFPQFHCCGPQKSKAGTCVKHFHLEGLCTGAQIIRQRHDGSGPPGLHASLCAGLPVSATQQAAVLQHAVGHTQSQHVRRRIAQIALQYVCALLRVLILLLAITGDQSSLESRCLYFPKKGSRETLHRLWQVNLSGNKSHGMDFICRIWQCHSSQHKQRKACQCSAVIKAS